MKILVTGAKGQLGSEINKISLIYNYEWIFTDREKFDLFELDYINTFLNKIKPDLIINCAAYTDVDKAEDDFENANIINNESVKIIAKWCNNNSCRLIHISTDYVYNQNLKIPIAEDSKNKPINFYGETKLLGDEACQMINPNSIVIRTSWLYSSFGDNFVKKMISSMKVRKRLNVINDQIGSPTYAADLAQVIIDIISFNDWKPGIYNYANEGKISWYDFAKDIKFLCGFNDVILNPVSSIDYFNKADRPKYSILDKTKIKKTFNVEINPYLDSLKRCIKILKNEW